MHSTSSILRAAAELAQRGEAFVLVTVIDVAGSTPRNPGARMIWRPGRPLIGTVGGGQFEHMLVDSAARCFEQQKSATERLSLKADADQCCGGVMTVFLEFIGPTHRIVIFGAGHVSRALADLLVHAPAEVVIVDDRPEWNSEARFGAARRICAWKQGIDVALEPDVQAMACVMTCSHDTDLLLLKDLLAGPSVPEFVGLIGSRSKRACLFTRLSGMGIHEDRVRSVRCPIGLGDMGKEPHQVAISIAGQLLLEIKSRNRSELSTEAGCDVGLGRC